MSSSIHELPLPNSALPPYVNSFARIEGELKNVSSLDSFICLLKNFLRDDELLGLSPWKEKLQGCYMSIISHCLLLPKLFPSGTVPFLAPGSKQSVTLSLAQIRCLNAHRFIGSFKKLEPHPCKWPMNLNHWTAKRPSWFPEGQAYLECLLDYFTDYPPGSSDEFTRSVVFTRHVLSDTETPNWDEDNFSTMVLAEAVVVDDGSGIGSNPGEVITDFANEDIGPSVAGTQEEIIFGFSPDLQPAVLFAGRMRENECIVMSGSKHFGKFSGYSSGLQYHGRTGSSELQTILAIDAEPARGGARGRLQQLQGGFMARELNKALVGFRAVASDSAGAPAVLATGKWGCGVFGGDLDIKHTVQMMACAMVQGRLQLKFYCIEDDAFSQRLRRVQPFLSGKTVREVFCLLEAYREHVQSAQSSAMPFFDFLEHNPAQAQRCTVS